jgi:SAM-dependent methyltransferase
MMTQPIAQRFREHKQSTYTREYYEKDVESAASHASRFMAASIIRDLDPLSVVDIGAGTGALLAEFASAGVRTLGLEYAEAGRDIAAGRGVIIKAFDIRFDDVELTWGRFEVACCTEVAEHIPEQYATRLVRLLCQLSDQIVFTAATPGQGGVDHINEQPHEYWIELFRRAGYRHDNAMSETWSAEWRAAGARDWYWKNVMVFSAK